MELATDKIPVTSFHEELVLSCIVFQKYLPSVPKQLVNDRKYLMIDTMPILKIGPWLFHSTWGKEKNYGTQVFQGLARKFVSSMPCEETRKVSLPSPCPCFTASPLFPASGHLNVLATSKTN